MKDDVRSSLILDMYNAFHEGEGQLPDIKDTDHVYDEGTGTLYCRVGGKEYKEAELNEASSYFVSVADSIEAAIDTSRNVVEQRRKARFCRYAAEALLYMLEEAKRS